MFAKLLLLFYFCIVTVVAEGPQSLRTAEDDAKAAFNDYYKVVLSGHNEVINLSEKYYGHALELMSKLETDITANVNTKLNSTIFYIHQIQDSLSKFNVTTCNYDYSALVEEMRAPLLNRTSECVALYKDVYKGLYNSTYEEASLLLNDMMSCQSRSLGQCVENHKNDDCFYFLIANFLKAADVATDAFNLMTDNYVNKFDAITASCDELINFQLSVWPDYYLQTVSSCAENELRNLRQTACPYNESLNK